MSDSQAAAGPSNTGSSLWTSIQNTFSSDNQTRSYNDDDEEEPLLPSRSKRQRLRTGWEQVLAYIVILTLGVVVGGFIGRRFASKGGEKGHGPMVAPVWTLPPVCHLSIQASGCQS
jgi:hypothetical protein